MVGATSGSPLAARRKLGSELRRLRDSLGLTTEEVGEHLQCHNSKVSRIERAKRACTKKDFAALMDFYEVSADLRATLNDLMLTGLKRVPPWWQAFADSISASYAEFLEYESEADKCCEYQPLLVPGQLQTEEYARAVTGVGFTALGPDQVDSLVEVRMLRQQRLREEDPMLLDVVVTEAALRLQVGGVSVMRAQLQHLRHIATQDNVTVRVIPFVAGENGASTGAFTLFGTGKETDADVAFMESAEATTFRDDPLTMKRLNRLYRSLSTAAASPQDSLELIENIEKELV
ncbi:helix-turn-helix domain-containing protein [Streptomyces sp. NPDC018584]|uniref:helix-turn-helix domain-containing protein n=1 Tax=unclassified Streptomyces TaxID=2593676 RepID=UPI0037AFBC3B